MNINQNVSRFVWCLGIFVAIYSPAQSAPGSGKVNANLMKRLSISRLPQWLQFNGCSSQAFTLEK